MKTNIEMIKSYWMATMAIDETREQMEAVWATEEGMEDLMDWYNDEVEAGCSIEDMDEAIKAAKNELKIENEKENNNMNTNTFTTVNGTTFTANESNTYFYAIWNEGGKQTKKRISKKEYEQAKREHELEVAAKMHENLEKLVAETEESNTDEEIERVLDEMAEDDGVTAEEFIEKLQKVEKEKKVRKAKKARAAQKNAAYSYSENGEVVVTLTEKQVDFIRHLPDTCFWEQGLDSCIWIDCLCDEIGGQFAGKPMTVGAMISTICEKGLGNRAVNRKGPRGGKCTSFALTEIGKLVAAELGLN